MTLPDPPVDLPTKDEQLEFILPKAPDSTLLSTEIKVEDGLSTENISSEYDSPEIKATTNLLNCVDNAVPS